jgi:hypothetical protein
LATAAYQIFVAQPNASHEEYSVQPPGLYSRISSRPCTNDRLLGPATEFLARISYASLLSLRLAAKTSTSRGGVFQGM